jgi:peptidoglycan/LPS O-acetylase OafA/YrhL
LFLALTILAAAASYRLYELPMRLRIRGMGTLGDGGNRVQ